MELKKLFEILDHHIDQKALMKDIALQILMPLLEKVVADSENSFDDIALAQIKKYIFEKL